LPVEGLFGFLSCSSDNTAWTGDPASAYTNPLGAVFVWFEDAHLIPPLNV